MDSKEFISFRTKLNKTQEEMAGLMGISVRAVRSYEQGWRTIPAHVERQLMFLVYQSIRNKAKQKPCWMVKKCPEKLKQKCPAWQFNSGTLCWFVNGTMCEGTPMDSWKKKIKICRSCEMLRRLFNGDMDKGE